MLKRSLYCCPIVLLLANCRPAATSAVQQADGNAAVNLNHTGKVICKVTGAIKGLGAATLSASCENGTGPKLGSVCDSQKPKSAFFTVEDSSSKKIGEFTVTSGLTEGIRSYYGVSKDNPTILAKLKSFGLAEKTNAVSLKSFSFDFVKLYKGVGEMSDTNCERLEVTHTLGAQPANEVSLNKPLFEVDAMLGAQVVKAKIVDETISTRGSEGSTQTHGTLMWEENTGRKTQLKAGPTSEPFTYQASYPEAGKNLSGLCPEGDTIAARLVTYTNAEGTLPAVILSFAEMRDQATGIWNIVGPCALIVKDDKGERFAIEKSEIKVLKQKAVK